MDIVELVLAIAGGISIIGGAVVVIARAVKPAFKLTARMKLLEEHDRNDLESIQEIKNTNRLLCEGLLSLLENTITGNSVDNLKTVRKKIQDYLIRK